MAYNSDSLTDQLTAIRVAIQNALEAQSYTVRGRTKNNALIDKLFAREDQIIQKINEASYSGGGMSSVGRMIPPL